MTKFKRIRFGLFELNLAERELRKQGIKIRLQEQPLQVLELLLQRPGELVTREALRADIWPADTFVDFDKGLYSAVNRLRESLQDEAEHSRFIETVPKHGYRFIAPVTQVVEVPEVPQPEIDPDAPDADSVSAPRGKTLIIVIVISAVTIAAAGSLLSFSSFNTWGTGGLFSGKRAARFQGLAVLPLENLSGDPAQEPFAEEMTEELIIQFSKLPDLRVISRTSVMHYKHSSKSLPQIAKELNVDAVIEGTVVRVDGRIRIEIRLVDAKADHQLWTENYERDFTDILALQSEVAKDVAAQCQIKLPAQLELEQQFRLSAPPNSSSQPPRLREPESASYEAYLMGRYYWNKRTGSSMQTAASYFQQAIQKDPSNALAYTGLSDYYAFLSLIGGPEIAPPPDVMPKAKAAAQKAEDLNPRLAEAHASMGHILHNYDWNFPAAEREFKIAIELNPNYAPAHHWYSHFLMQVGRTNESLVEAMKAHELDPLSPFINNGLARQYFLSRQYDKAIAQAQKALEIDPNYVPAIVLMGMAYEQKSMFPEAIAQYERAEQLAAGYAVVKGGPAAKAAVLPVVESMLGHAFALSGRQAEAREKLQELIDLSRTRYVSSSYLAVIYIGLKDNGHAFAELDKDYKNRSERLLYLKVEPMVDPLRSDPRFGALVARVGLPN